MKEKIKYLDYLFVLRPTLLFPVWTFFLAGYHANLCFDANKKLLDPKLVQNNNPIVAFVLLSFLMGAVYIFNQIADIETDAKNQKIFFIANGIISQKLALVEGIILTIVAIGLAFVLEFKLGISFVLIFLCAGIFYSIKPFSWKDKPIWGVMAHLGGGWLVPACGWIAAGTLDWRFCIYAIPYAVALVSGYLLTTIPDIPGDRESGKITFGVRYGEKVTIYWAVFFELLSIGFSFLTRDYVLFLPALAAFPLYVIAVVRQKTEDVIRAIKFTILFVSLAVCVKFLTYFLVILVTYYFSKWYYRKRFDLEYPKFAA